MMPKTVPAGCGRAGSHTQMDCSGFAIWSDGTTYDSTLVPEMHAIMDFNDRPMRYLIASQVLDDQLDYFTYHYMCEVQCWP